MSDPRCVRRVARCGCHRTRGSGGYGNSRAGTPRTRRHADRGSGGCRRSRRIGDHLPVRLSGVLSPAGAGRGAGSAVPRGSRGQLPQGTARVRALARCRDGEISRDRRLGSCARARGLTSQARDRHAGGSLPRDADAVFVPEQWDVLDLRARGVSHTGSTSSLHQLRTASGPGNSRWCGCGRVCPCSRI